MGPFPHHQFPSGDPERFPPGSDKAPLGGPFLQ